MEDRAVVVVVVAEGSRSFVVVEVVVGSLWAGAGSQWAEVVGIEGLGKSLLDRCGAR